jgi:hypothetical protein
MFLLSFETQGTAGSPVATCGFPLGSPVAILPKEPWREDKSGCGPEEPRDANTPPHCTVRLQSLQISVCAPCGGSQGMWVLAPGDWPSGQICPCPGPAMLGTRVSMEPEALGRRGCLSTKGCPHTRHSCPSWQTDRWAGRTQVPRTVPTAGAEL